MPRLLYYAFPSGPVQGGVKMIVRHVEALRELGFDAFCCMGADNPNPSWFEHRAPILRAPGFRRDDVLVVPSDAHSSLRQAPGLGLKCVVFEQNPYVMAALSLASLDLFPPDRPPAFVSVAPSAAEVVRRLYPSAEVEIVPCFADERVFRPGAEREEAVVFAPRKRPFEARAIRELLPRLHKRHAALLWRELTEASEAEVAERFGSSTLFLSLSRLESVGLTPLEAMACGCVCAGFTGIGGWEYATADNGFWAPDDDCVAAADALAQAADLVATGGAELRRRLEAGYETAAQWSYARFRERLEVVWMRLAPEARVKDGPLD